MGFKENKLPFKPEQTVSACGSTFKKGRINFPIKANQVWKVIKINSLGQNKNKENKLNEKQRLHENTEGKWIKTSCI